MAREGELAKSSRKLRSFLLSKREVSAAHCGCAVMSIAKAFLAGSRQETYCFHRSPERAMLLGELDVEGKTKMLHCVANFHGAGFLIIGLINDV